MVYNTNEKFFTNNFKLINSNRDCLTAKMEELADVQAEYDNNESSELAEAKQNLNFRLNSRNNEKMIIGKLSKFMESLGFSPKQIGFHFLAYAAYLCYKNQIDIKNLSETIYKNVAHKFATTIYCVEKNIRTAVSTAKRSFWKNSVRKQDLRLTNKHVIYKLSTIINRF